MTIHEFGKENERIVVLLHPSGVMWDYFEYLIPLMQDRYHLVVPALPGYDEDRNDDFTGIEQISIELSNWLLDRGYKEIECIYGCSMGGAIVTRFLADDRVKAKSAVIDGGITPYQLPWIATRFIAIRDFLMIYMGKLGGIKLLEKAFNTDEYSDEDLKYITKVLKHMSARTVWRTFESANNYKMPDDVHTSCRKIEYWFTTAEKKARKWDMDYIRKVFPQAVFREFTDAGHGGLAVFEPDRMAAELGRLMEQ
jgi:pimeloyl-ACP methyl ester carboxylesterase